MQYEGDRPECLDCPHFHVIEEKQHLSNGDPGYPEDNWCDYDFECPYAEEAEEDDD
jgi:hypothetical protein